MLLIHSLQLSISAMPLPAVPDAGQFTFAMTVQLPKALKSQLNVLVLAESAAGRAIP